MEPDRSQAVRQRITEAYRRQKAQELQSVRNEARSLRELLYGMAVRLARVTQRVAALEEQQLGDDTTTAIPVLPPRPGG